MDGRPVKMAVQTAKQTISYAVRVTFRQNITTRTRSQDIKNNNVKVPPTKGATVKPTLRPPVVSTGTSTEGL